jgi:hypothetical protein
MKLKNRILAGIGMGVVVNIGIAVYTLLPRIIEDNSIQTVIKCERVGSYFIVRSAQNYEDSIKSIAKIESDQTTAMGLRHEYFVNGSTITIRLADRSISKVICEKVL